MGRKSSSKGQAPPPAVASTPERRGVNPLVWGAVLIAVIAAGLLALRPAAGPDAPAAAPSATASPTPAEEQAVQPDGVSRDRADAIAKFGPHSQANLPPLPFRSYDPPRPRDVVVAAYQFAAEHPEVLSYVPCFCGCEQAGHQGNHDCFVKSRDVNGDVTAWDEHGVECTVCIDVANRSRQLYASGASVRDIRAVIEKEFASAYPGRTPTPSPPASHSH